MGCDKGLASTSFDDDGDDAIAVVVAGDIVSASFHPALLFHVMLPLAVVAAAVVVELAAVVIH